MDTKMLTGRQHSVLGALKRHGKLNFQELENVSGVSGSLLDQDLRALRTMGYVRRGLTAKFSITPNGVKAYGARTT